ncbi:MAG: hypothetical protein M3Q49_00725 [Actinomycetota bacterium]|nr:hypothetical protein [Actinomycetota bacterium]
MTIATRRPGRTRPHTVRLSMDVPKALHKQLRMRALTEDVTMTEHVIALIERDLGIDRTEGKTTKD